MKLMTLSERLQIEVESFLLSYRGDDLKEDLSDRLKIFPLSDM